MFTGLIEQVGVVRAAGPSAAGVSLAIDPAGWAYRPSRGDSVAVNGCCLTVAQDLGPDSLLHFDAIPETLAKTTIGALKPGSRVNLEQSATLATALGGHLVQGHVDGVAVVESVVTAGEWRVRFRPPADLMQYIVPKGSVTLEGVSLTVASVDPASGWFEVTLIPTTLDKTTLKELAPGARCNIECDAMAKTVVHYLRHYGGGGGGSGTSVPRQS